MWIAAAEIAGLPGLPAHERTVRMRAEREGWRCRTEPALGGPNGERHVYHLLSLPAPARAALIERAVDCPLPGPPQAGPGEEEAGGTPALPIDETTALADWQRRVMDARAALLGELDRLAAEIGRTAAAQLMVAMARDGGLGDLQGMVPVANARSRAEAEAAPTRRGFAASTSPARGGGEKRVLSERTLRRWAREREARGVAGLAPATPAARAPEVPDWGPHLLRLYRRPSKPSLRACLAQLPQDLPGGIAPPSYDQARRWLDRLSTVERERGRRGANGLAALRGHKRRDTSGLAPLDIVSADGHTLKADVQHPMTGRPFRPELMAVIDVETRRTIGWSAGLAESAHVVMDAMRHTATGTGVPAIFYSDNGPGFIARAMTDEVLGFLARIGTHHERSRPNRPQGRGLVERLQASLWIDAAKWLPAYAGRDMDRDLRKRVQKLTRRDLQAHGSSRLLMDWGTFLGWAQEAVDTYNARPHSALPRIRDPETGGMRHQSPDEAWAAARAAGWQPVTLPAEAAEDLWRPYEERVVRRAEVQLPWGRYYAAALEPWHGETVRVGYDIHDGSRVWVRDCAGRLICTAARDGNVTPYMPQTKVEHAAGQRARRRLALVEDKARDIETERRGVTTIEQAPLTPEQQAAADDAWAEMEARAERRALEGRPQMRPANDVPPPQPHASAGAGSSPARDCRVGPDGPPRNDEEAAGGPEARAPGGRPVFRDDLELAAWLLANPERCRDADRDIIRECLRSRPWRQLAEWQDLDLGVLEEIACRAVGAARQA